MTDEKIIRDLRVKPYITFTVRTKDTKYTMEFRDINGVNCGISIESTSMVRINNHTSHVEIDDGRFPEIIANSEITIYIDPLLIGQLYDIEVRNEDEWTYIRAVYK